MEEYESKAESLAEELIPSIHDSLETVNGIVSNLRSRWVGH